MPRNGKKIVEYRKARGWSQKHLADLMGVQQPAVALWEKEKAYPTDENISKLAEIFSVDRKVFFIDPALSEKDLLELFDKLKALPISQQLACASVIREFYELPSNN
jgi:transcriptional regulator with XRE-family HTH domain